MTMTIDDSTLFPGVILWWLTGWLPPPPLPAFDHNQNNENKHITMKKKDRDPEYGELITLAKTKYLLIFTPYTKFPRLI